MLNSAPLQTRTRARTDSQHARTRVITCRRRIGYKSTSFCPALQKSGSARVTMEKMRNFTSYNNSIALLCRSCTKLHTVSPRLLERVCRVLWEAVWLCLSFLLSLLISGFPFSRHHATQTGYIVSHAVCCVSLPSRPSPSRCLSCIPIYYAYFVDGGALRPLLAMLLLVYLHNVYGLLTRSVDQLSAAEFDKIIQEETKNDIVVEPETPSECTPLISPCHVWPHTVTPSFLPSPPLPQRPPSTLWHSLLLHCLSSCT